MPLSTDQINNMNNNENPVPNATTESLQNGEETLTFEDTGSFRHWLKRQRKTSFSVPLYMQNANYCHQYVSVTKAALDSLRIDDNEAVIVHLRKTKRGDRYYAYVEPKRLPRL